VGAASAVKLLIAGSSWRLAGVRAAGGVLVSAVTGSDPDDRVLAGILLTRAGDRTLWLAWAGGYRTLERKCEAVVNELGRSRLPEVVVTERETYEHGSLFRYASPDP